MYKRIISIFLIMVTLSSLLALSVLSAPTSQNLVEGLTYKTETGVPISSSYENQKEPEAEDMKLTDGVYGSLSVDSEGWYKFKRGVTRSVIFDLGNISRISYVKAGFLHAKEFKVYAPRYINVWLSDDGINYGCASRYTTNYNISRLNISRYDALIKLDNTFSARYIKIEICCDDNMYCDEIQVYGSYDLEGNEAKVVLTPDVDMSSYPQSIAGVSNIAILKNGYNSENPQLTEFSQSELYPYVVYLDQNGDIQGTMFDGIVFYPNDSVYPSGGNLVGKGEYKMAVMSDWEFYIEKTLSDLNALELAVSKAYSKIGLNKKFKVFFTIPFPKSNNQPFGDYDNDGVDEYCRTITERNAVTRWYVEKCLAEFEKSDYSYLSLGGFCWGNNEINYAETDFETELVRSANEYIQNKGYETLFLSDYLGVGFTDWKTLGFSDSVMRPNSINLEENGFDISVIKESAENSKKYQMGVNIEIPDLSVFEGDNYQKAGFNYETFLFNGKSLGYMSGLKTFEQGIGAPFYEFCYADWSTPKGKYMRRLYDLTFKFIHLTYNNVPPQIEIEDNIELVNGDSNITLHLGIVDTDSYQGDLKIEFTLLPAHGSVIASANKNALIYSTDNGFVGEDSFAVRISDGFNYSEEKVIKVTVLPPEAFEKPNSKEDSTSVDIVIPVNPITDKIPPLLLGVLAVLGLAIVIVSLSMIFKPKKK